MRLARLDIAPELLGEILPMMPTTMRIIGSEDTRQNGVVRLVVDVTATGERGGDWQGLVTINGATKTATFGPRP